jgi:hypothetical protein
MDKTLARHAIMTTFHSLSLLQDLITVLEQHCSKDEFDAYTKAIASVLGHATAELLNPIFLEVSGTRN